MNKPFNFNVAAVTLLAVAGATEETAAATSYNFAVIPKNTNNDFFSVVKEGCRSRSAQLPNVTCLYVGPAEEDPAAQASIIDGIVNGTIAGEDGGRIDGISISVSDKVVIGEAVDRATEAGIPVITFDSDAPDCTRRAYIGTDNFAFGEELGKVLDQLDPEGGKYGILAAAAPNVLDRIRGVRERLSRSKWNEVENSWKDCLDSKETAVEIMYEFAQEKVDAIIPVGGWPMYLPDQWRDFVDSHRHLTLVVGDTLPVQLDLMNRGYVNGLVGQLPFNMGEQSIDVLLKLAQGGEVSETIFGTSLLEVLQFPIVLPELVVDENYIGRCVVLGYVFFSLIAAASLGLGTWVYIKRNTRVVKASQPFFLQMTIAGVLVFSSAIIPLSFDGQHYSQKVADVSCMATPWLMTIGFTTLFSALYTKTRRINLILRNPQAFRRVKVTEKDVLKPYLAFMASNIIVLACWTAFAPLTYQRFDQPGTDDWNRVIATFGTCVSASEEGDRTYRFVPFLAIICLLNLGLLILANMQAYHARTIQTEYSESKYIGVIMASILQSFLLGAPIIGLLWNIPRALYIVLVMLITCVSMFVLNFLFVPKIIHTRLWIKEREEKKRQKELARQRVIKTPSGNGIDVRSSSSISSSRQSELDSGLKIAFTPEAEFNQTFIKKPSSRPVEHAPIRGKGEDERATRGTVISFQSDSGLNNVVTPEATSNQTLMMKSSSRPLEHPPIKEDEDEDEDDDYVENEREAADRSSSDDSSHALESLADDEISRGSSDDGDGLTISWVSRSSNYRPESLRSIYDLSFEGNNENKRSGSGSSSRRGSRRRSRRTSKPSRRSGRPSRQSGTTSWRPIKEGMKDGRSSREDEKDRSDRSGGSDFNISLNSIPENMGNVSIDFSDGFNNSTPMTNSGFRPAVSSVKEGSDEIDGDTKDGQGDNNKELEKVGHIKTLDEALKEIERLQKKFARESYVRDSHGDNGYF